MSDGVLDIAISREELKENFDEILSQVSVGAKVTVNDEKNNPVALCIEPKLYDEYLQLLQENILLKEKIKDLEYIKRAKIKTPDNLIESEKSLLKIKHKFPFFTRCTDMELLSVVKDVKIMKLAPNEKIFLENDPCREIYYIVSGTVDVIKNIDDSSDIKHIGTLAESNIFGEMAYLTKKPRSASIRVSKDAPCVLISFNIQENISAELEYIYTKIYHDFAQELAKKVKMHFH